MKGVLLRVSFSFWALLLLAVWAGENTAQLIAAAAIHEGGHLLALWALGGHVAAVELRAVGIRMRAKFSQLPPRRRKAAMLLAGPAAGFLAALLAAAAGAVSFARLNLALSCLNLLPLPGLYGGELFALRR